MYTVSWDHGNKKRFISMWDPVPRKILDSLEAEGWMMMGPSNVKSAVKQSSKVWRRGIVEVGSPPHNLLIDSRGMLSLTMRHLEQVATIISKNEGVIRPGSG